MDRNANFRPASLFDLPVALRKESVDRNDAMQIVVVVVHPSLSARRAWIEMPKIGSMLVRSLVALRKESVDRNAQIGITKFSDPNVALRKESVDRNDIRYTTTPRPSMSLSARRAWIEMTNPKNRKWRSESRSPQGERG